VFNAQGSRSLEYLVVQVGAVKIYYAAAAGLEALKKKERGGQQLKQDETQFTTKIQLTYLTIVRQTTIVPWPFQHMSVE
jgi:hypothetical protein